MPHPKQSQYEKKSKAKKLQARKDAEMIEFRCWIADGSGYCFDELKDTYDRICDECGIPENLRTKFK